MPITNEAKTFNRLQEAIRKDVDLLFGVLTKRFHIALHPERYRYVQQLITTYKAVYILHNMCVDSLRDGVLSRREGAGETNQGRDADGDDEGPPGGAAAAAGGHDGSDNGADSGGAAAAGGPMPGGGGAAGPTNDVGPANLPPAFNAEEQPPPRVMVAVFDAWGETRYPTEHEQLRVDLTAHVWSDLGELLAPYAV